MPRKHRGKGSPQDSIDSILLAISRREDIDPETLSHYLARLDEEWTSGAREKVIRLLYTNDANAHAASVTILSELATEFDVDELEDVVADPTVSDLAKLSLAPILKELGSEMADEGMIDYLNDPLSAMQQMQLRLLELVGQSEMGVESILEDVTSMPVERRLGFISWLGSSNDARAAQLLIPLLESQPAKVVTEVIDALEQLGPIAFQQSIPALKHVVATVSNRTIKQHARAVLGRLTMQLAPGTEEAAMDDAQQHAQHFYDARVSFIDGAGSQLIMLSWKRPDELLKGVNVLYQDQWGIKDCYGIDEMDTDRWNTLVKELEQQGFSSFQVPFEYARALVAEARAVNKRTRRKLPIAYSVWRPLIESEAEEKHTAETTMLPLATLNETTLALAQHGDELYNLSEFISWMYDPPTRIEPYMTRYWTLSNPFSLLENGKASKKRSKTKAKEKERRDLLETIATEALNELTDDKWRALYDARLRRQAALFKMAGREQEARIAQAVATVLNPTSNIPVQQQAFPRAMMYMSIEQGPLRMMAEALNSGDINLLDLLDIEE